MRRLLLSLLVLAMSLVACSTARLATPSGETQIGDQLAAEVEQKIGLVEDPELAAYVAAVGARLVASSESIRHGLEYRFRVLDMTAPNAFALPGGHVFVSRGLLVLLQTEDELANVLAHEIAHVSARHHLRHAIRQTPFVPLRIATGLGALATGIVSPLLGKTVAVLGNAPTGLVLAAYSRGQENEADTLGQGFAAEAGWDPLAMARVMEALGRYETQRGGDPNRRNYFATHPTTPDRARKTAARAQTLTVESSAPIAREQRIFLQQLEGLLVGDPASHGVIAANEYLHPTLDFHLTFPMGWAIGQDDRSVRAVAPDKDAMVLLTLVGEGDDPEAVAQEVLAKSDLQVEVGPTTRWSQNLTGTYAIARFEQGRSQYRYALAWIAHQGRVYEISAGAELDAWLKRQEALEAVARSFRPLQTSDTPKLREGRLRVVAGKGRSLEALLPEARAWSLEATAVANAIDSIEEPIARWVKVAPLEPYRPEPESESESEPEPESR